MTSLSDLNTDIIPVIDNPLAIASMVFDRLEDGTLVDPSNPFVFGIEAACQLTTALSDSTFASLRKVYPSLAVEEIDMYRHMSDEDYKNRFALPSLTKIHIFVGIEELYAKAIESGIEGVRKLVIPKNSTVSIAGYTFTMQYAIELRIMAHGGLQVVYDVNSVSPLLTLDSNVVDYRFVTLSGIEFVDLQIPIYQMDIKTTYDNLSSATGFTTLVPFTDQYYYCRIYHADSNGNWIEIKTTHSDQVYSTTEPTAVLTKLSNSLKIHIPIIYMTSDLIGSELRIDIYTTKGPLELNLANFDSREFIANWVDLDGGDTTYSAPFETFSTLTIYSDSLVTGGKNQLTTSELRSRIIANSFSKQNIPITEFQLTNKLEDLGYSIVKSIDNITKRVYLATRALPLPTDNATATGAGVGIMMLQESMEHLSALSTVVTNGDRITILPETLYKRENGVVYPLTDVEAISLLSNTVDNLITLGNNTDFIFSPFHYVLDANNSKFNVRSYFLNSPVITGKSFIKENPSTGLQISVKDYLIEKTETGYKLYLTTRSSAEMVLYDSSLLSVQLSYIAPEERYRAFMEGVLEGQDPDSGERVYSFDIVTNYDFTEKDRFNVTSFKMFDDTTVRDLLTNLETTFDVVFIVRDNTSSSIVTSDIDSVVATYLMPTFNSMVAITREQLHVTFGHALTDLWTKSKTVASGIEYETYDTDVLYYYPENVYATDNAGNIDLVYNTTTNKVEATLLHAVGTQAFDVNGDPVYKHRVGTIVLDNDGKPVPKHPRKLLRQIYMCFLDGKYYLANSESAITYTESIPNTIINWLENDIEPNSELMLEETELLLYPQTTLGTVGVINESGTVVNIEAEQVIDVDVYLTEQDYKNVDLRVQMTKAITKATAEEIGKVTVSLTTLIKTLESLVPNAFGFTITGLGGSKDIKVATIKDLSQRLMLGKRLALFGDGTITIEDAINVNYFNHVK